MNYFINIKDFIYYNRKYFIVAIIVIVILSFSLINTFGLKNAEKSNEVELYKKEDMKEIDNESEEEKISCFVDIKGEVVSPGLYEVDSDKRVMDVISLAGGLLENADTSNINLSMKVNDEMVIIIPKKEEKDINNDYVIKNDAEIKQNNSINENPKSVGKVSINNASLEELMGISGIGEVKAKKIIEYRNSHGKFNSLEELTNVSGIGTKTLEKIKEYLTL